MFDPNLLHPESIVVVGGSADTGKPGGRVLSNILAEGFSGPVTVVNPKADGPVQGCETFASPDQVPAGISLAIVSIPGKFVEPAVEILAGEKGVKAFVILSAGFGEMGPEGAAMERSLVACAERHGACLVGPNCMGILSPTYAGTFAGAVPRMVEGTCDFVSGSGATAAFIMEVGIPRGLALSSLVTVGNAAQTSVEDVLEWLDESYEHGVSAPTKMLYLESLNDPQRLLKHARSLRRKGARIVAVKAGASDSGGRAASSHTGAMASPDHAVSALFDKAGIVRAASRTEMVEIACAFSRSVPRGKRVAIVTHAGGPGVILADALSEEGLEVPEFPKDLAAKIAAGCFPGTSGANPVDYLATGTAAQLGFILDTVEAEAPVDAIACIFGYTGMHEVFPVYETIHERAARGGKPIYPILTSPHSDPDALRRFLELGEVNFPEETAVARALGKIVRAEALWDPDPAEAPEIDRAAVRAVVDAAEKDAYLSPEGVDALLRAAGIATPRQTVVREAADALAWAAETGYPLVAKAVGPVHKTDIGGVLLGIDSDEALKEAMAEILSLPETHSVLLQTQHAGQELILGLVREGDFGHQVMLGLGGIFAEALKDVSFGLAPLSEKQALAMIDRLRGRALVDGVRGRPGIDRPSLAEVVRALCALAEVAPEIAEMDVNPLLGEGRCLTAVDARIRLA